MQSGAKVYEFVSVTYEEIELNEDVPNNGEELYYKAKERSPGCFKFTDEEKDGLREEPPTKQLYFVVNNPDGYSVDPVMARNFFRKCKIPGCEKFKEPEKKADEEIAAATAATAVAGLVMYDIIP